jgi:hypothetical protein
MSPPARTYNNSSGSDDEMNPIGAVGNIIIVMLVLCCRYKILPRRWTACDVENHCRP